jgi:T5SS/PEP-CTERM-associated repeat protein/autotransporter-associated beta strand protein
MVTVSGSSTLSLTGSFTDGATRGILYVGEYGEGTLNISNGGRVDAMRGVLIGEEEGAKGTVTVTNPFSSLDTPGYLFVGNYGDGTLEISDEATVFAGGAATIGGNGGNGRGKVTVDGYGSSLTVVTDLYLGRSNGAEGTLEVKAGGAVNVTNNASIGDAAGSKGKVTVNGSDNGSGNSSTLHVSGTLAVGNSGEGTLEITNGGVVEADSYAYIAYAVGSKGTVTVSGAGSIWDVKTTLDVGRLGEGTLNITSGGKVKTGGSVTIGSFFIGTPSIGLVTVSGSGSALDINSSLDVGHFGNGTLEITDAGVVKVKSTVNIGISSRGAVTVSGLGSALNAQSDLHVGYFNNATLEITDEGVATVAYVMSIGNAAGSTGTVTVSDSGSALIVNNSLTVGGIGEGTLNITSGGKVEAKSSVNIAAQQNSKGTVTVSGSGSSLDVGTTLYVGNAGEGTLEITGGGKVEVGDTIYLGFVQGGKGAVTVSGSGSILNTEGILAVGTFGEGTLDITGGGKVNVKTDAYIATNPNSKGAATVSGNGSVLNVEGILSVGNLGEGKLEITGRGVVEAKDEAYIGNGADSTGTVTVSGSGSALNVTTGIYLGRGGTSDGTLEISDHGAVTSGGATFIGFGQGGSKGTVTVSDSGSVLTVNGVLAVGFYGDGKLEITNGGEVIAKSLVYIAATSNSSGSATVSGAGSILNASGTFSVGDGGEGTLEITDGGKVETVTQVYIGHYAGSKGTVTVSDTDSALNVGSSLNVGYSGEGTLEITNGGKVKTEVAAYIGYDVDSKGTVTVSGSGSALNVKSTLSIGYNSTVGGTLEITDGGKVTSGGPTYIGYGTASKGTVTVSGSGSALNIDFEFTLGGYLSEGKLEITNGGEVTANDWITIGATSGSNVSVTVSGTNSYLHAGSFINVGNFGEGTLNITSGGKVEAVSYAHIGENAGSKGTVTVSGIGSRLDAKTYIEVGVLGEGTMEITNGGVVKSTTATYIGYGANASGSIHSSSAKGTVIVSGAGSILDVGSLLSVGTYGNGRLEISNGGVVKTSYNTLIGYETGSTGAVTVSGSGSALNVGYALYVGDGVTGTLDITDGGTVTSVNATRIGLISYGLSGRGTVTVSGAGSTLEAGTYISVGDTKYAEGTLNIEDGGTVSSDHFRIGGGLIITSPSTGTLNLRTGGTLATNYFKKGTGVAYLNFNGGTIRATNSEGDFFQDFDDIPLNGSGLVGNTAALIFEVTNAAHTVTIQNALTGTGGLAKSGAGTLILSGSSNSTYTGTTTVSGGTLKVAGTLSGGVNHPNDIVLAEGNIIFTPTGEQTFSGAISGTGTIAFETPHDVIITGTLSPGIEEGAIGTLTFQNTGNVTLASGSRVVVDLSAAATTADLLIVKGSNLALQSGAGGVALVVVVGDGIINEGTEFIIVKMLEGGSIEGVFADGTTSVSSPDGQEFSISYEKDGENDVVKLTKGMSPHGVGAVPEPSTYALYGGIGALLLALWRKRRRDTAAPALDPPPHGNDSAQT